MATTDLQGKGLEQLLPAVLQDSTKMLVQNANSESTTVQALKEFILKDVKASKVDIATPSTENPDPNTVYLAFEAGYYPPFDGNEVIQGEFVIFKYSIERNNWEIYYSSADAILKAYIATEPVQGLTYLLIQEGTYTHFNLTVDAGEIAVATYDIGGRKWKKDVSVKGGGAGTTDYTQLTHKPQIGGNVLEGNKTAESLGLQESLKGKPIIKINGQNVQLGGEVNIAGGEGGGGSIIIDDTLDSTSPNAIQNQAVAKKLSELGNSLNRLQAVKVKGDELFIGYKYDDNNDLIIHFAKCMFNELMTFQNVSIAANSNPFVSLKPDRNIIRTLNNAANSDNISAFYLRTYDGNKVSNIGGSQKWRNGSEPGFPNVKTAKTVSFSFYADGVKLKDGDNVLAKVVEVRVENMLFDPKISPSLGEDILSSPLITENNLYRIEEGNIFCSISYHFLKEVNPVSTLYGMQSCFTEENNLLTPNGKFVDFHPVRSSDEISFKKNDYPNFNRFIEKSQDGDYQVTYLFNNGLGNHDRLKSNTSKIFLYSYGKSYHNVIDNDKILQGDNLFWTGLYCWNKPIEDNENYISYSVRYNGKTYYFAEIKKPYKGYVKVSSDAVGKLYSIVENNHHLSVGQIEEKGVYVDTDKATSIVLCLSQENEIKNDDTIHINNNHRMLVVGYEGTSPYANRMPVQFFKAGIIAEYCSFDTFVNHYYDDFDIIMFGSLSIPIMVSATCDQIKNQLKKYLDKGAKFIALADAHVQEGLYLIKEDEYGYEASGKVNIGDILDPTLKREVFDGKGAEYVSIEEIKDTGNRDLLSLPKFNGHFEMRYGGNYEADNLIRPIKVTYTIGGISKDAYPTVYKRGKYGIIQYGGNGDANASFRYLRFDNFIKEVLAETDDHLAIGYIKGQLGVGYGMDCDVTKRPDSVEYILEAVGDTTPFGVGLRTSELDTPITSRYRSMKYRYPDVRFCTHLWNHYADNPSKNRYTTEETRTVDKNGVIYPYHMVKIRDLKVFEVTSSGDVECTRVDWVGSLKGNNYFVAKGRQQSKVDEYTPPIQFLRSNAGKKFKLTYSWVDDSHEIIGSVLDLEKFGCITDRCVYTSMGNNSISSQSYDTCMEYGITLAEYTSFPAYNRMNFLQRGLSHPIPMMYGQSSLIKEGLTSGFNDGFSVARYDASLTEYKKEVNTICSNAKSFEVPIVDYVHDFIIDKEDLSSIWKESDTSSVRGSWKADTYENTVKRLQDAYKAMFEIYKSPDNDFYISTRQELTKRLYDIHKCISYDIIRSSNAIDIVIYSTSKEVLEGITFKLKCTPKTIIGDNIHYRSENGDCILWTNIHQGKNVIKIVG